MIRRLFLILCFAMTAPLALAEPLKLAVTSSFHNSGLADVLLPEIAKATDLDVQLLVVGTGQALRLGRAGDVDAILVHSKVAEEAFVSEGFAPHRREIMFNDFVLIGPKSDPAKAGQTKSAAAAFAQLAQTEAPFVSRGDDSGTHRREIALWRAASQEPKTLDGNWYRSVGAGMGAALNVASAMEAYILSDRASWLKFANKGDLALLFAGDDALFNQYAYLPINPARHAHVNASGAQRLEIWLTGPQAAALIDGYRLNDAQLFTFNAQ